MSAGLPPGLPDTPCIGLCSAGFDDVCRGCGRTVGEIAEWLFLDDAERAEVWRRLLAAGWAPRRGSLPRSGS